MTIEINTEDIENGVVSQSIIDTQEAYKAEHGKYLQVLEVSDDVYSLRIDEAVHPDGEASYAVYATKLDEEKIYSRVVGKTDWLEVTQEPLELINEE